MTAGASSSIVGRRIFITGAARGIGAALARRLHDRGARVALAGLEPEQLAAVGTECGDAPWFECDVCHLTQVDAAVSESVEALGGLEVVVANAGVAAQLPLVGGDPEVMRKTVEVNLMGAYNTIRAAAPHVAHEDGYFLCVASVGAAVHLPLMGAYCASKAAVEALGDCLRIELRHTGGRVGVAYFAELDTDMTRRGFDTKAARRMPVGKRVTPLEAGIDALERGIARRARRIVAPRWAAPALPLRMGIQRVADVVAQRNLPQALATARAEKVTLTTPQPEDDGADG